MVRGLPWLIIGSMVKQCPGFMMPTTLFSGTREMRYQNTFRDEQYLFLVRTIYTYWNSGAHWELYETTYGYRGHNMYVQRRTPSTERTFGLRFRFHDIFRRGEL